MHHQFDESAAVAEAPALPPRTPAGERRDVSDELFRTYTFPGGEVVRVDRPVGLWVTRKANGDSHRIACENGNGVYIPAGWLKIEWANKPGKGPVAW